MLDHHAHDNTEEVSARERRRDELLREAIQRPGVREVLKVYESWKQADRAMDSHRMIAHPPGLGMNRTNACESR